MIKKDAMVTGLRRKQTAKGNTTSLWLETGELDYDLPVFITVKDFTEEVAKFMEEVGIKRNGDVLTVTFEKKEEKK